MRVSAHVAYYSSIVIIGTGAALGIAKIFGTNEEEKQRIVVRRLLANCSCSRNDVMLLLGGEAWCVGE